MHIFRVFLSGVLISLGAFHFLAMASGEDTENFELPVENNVREIWFQAKNYTNPTGCLSPGELAAELEKHRVDVSSFPENSAACPDGYQQQLYRLFERLKDLKLDASVPEPNEIVRTLKDPLGFFESSYSTLRYYPSDRAYASFNPSTRLMQLSDAFFQQPQIVGIAILMHESAHSREEDMGHAQCYQGQLMATYGGCDMQLSQKPSQSGAYGYEFWFSWVYSKYSKQLVREEKLYLRQKALNLATHRFNHVFEVVAFTDLIVGLDQSNQLNILDPIKKQWRSLQHPRISGVSPDSTIARIDYDARSHGLNLIMQDGRLIQWDSIAREFVSQLDLPFEDLDQPLAHIRRVFDFDVGAPRTVAFTSDGSLWRETTDLENQGAKVFLPFLLPSDLLGDPLDVISLVGPKTAFLNSLGQLQIFERQRSLSVGMVGWPQNPRGIFPSLNGSYLYVIDSDTGKLLEGTLVQRTLGPILELDRVEFKKDFLQVSVGSRAKKYQEGFSQRVLLDENGSLRVSRHRDVVRKIPLPEVHDLTVSGVAVKDVAIVRTARFQSSWDFDKNPLEKSSFEQKCSVEASVKDPWLERWMGVNSQKQWIVDDQGQCLVMDQRVESLSSGIADIKLNPFGYPESLLKMKRVNEVAEEEFQPFLNW